MESFEAHPVARSILTDAFFWAQGDDYAPHGNDTGNDVLGAYRRACARARRPPDPAKFLRKLLREWEMDPGDWFLLEGAHAVRAIHKDRSRLLLDDALVGLAFAVLKVQGCMPAPLREIALIAIERQALDAVIELRGWESAAHRRATLDKMRVALEAAATAQTPPGCADAARRDRRS